MVAEEEREALAEEEGAALAEEEEVPLIRWTVARRTTGLTSLESLAAEWGHRDDDDVPIAQLRRRHSAGSSGVPEEEQGRPEGSSLEPVVGQLAPEREEARPGAGSEGVVPPATSTGVQEPPTMEEEPPATDEEPLEGGAAGSRVWSREEGRDLARASWRTITCATPP